MGVIAKCCNSQYLYSDIDYPSKENQNQENNTNLIKKIPEVKDSNQGLNYICSKECYNIITKISKTTFTKKLSKGMSTEGIYILLKKLIERIITFQYTENDLIIKKYISKIQIYTKLGTKKIILELNTVPYMFEKEERELLLRSLSDWALLTQMIISLANSNDKSLKNKFINKNIKNYVFDGIYFLIKIKSKHISYEKETLNLDRIFPIQTNIKVNSDTKNEIKKIVALAEDFFVDLIDYK